MATDHLIRLSKDESMRMIEEARFKEQADRVSRETYARDEGIQQGIQQGRVEGLQEGMQQVVLNMLKKSADIDFISEVTGLSQEEINKLKNSS